MPPPTMMRTIEQAISDLILSNKAITVANAFPVYMRLAGFNSLCDEAVMSFEHAMDKYPAKPPKARATFIKEVKELRDGYWLDKLGGTPSDFCGGFCGGCSRCNEHMASLVTLGILEGDVQVTYTPLKKRLRRPKKTKKLVKAPEPAQGTPFDPYAASTSAVLL